MNKLYKYKFEIAREIYLLIMEICLNYVAVISCLLTQSNLHYANSDIHSTHSHYRKCIFKNFTYHTINPIKSLVNCSLIVSNN